MKRSLSVKKLWWLLGCLWGIALLTACYFSIGSRYFDREPYAILAQTGSQKEGVTSADLAEWLDIPIGSPLSSDRVDFSRMTALLQKQPMIKEGSVKKGGKGVLLVDYTLRSPVALLGDFSNLAIDEEGYIFPFFPFFSPKRLPRIYFGLSTLPTKRLEGDKKEMAFAVLAELKQRSWRTFFTCLEIDVSRVVDHRFGWREMVVVCHTKEKARHFLRLPSSRFQKEFSRYFAIKDRWKGDRIFDLRLDQLAFVSSLDEAKDPLPPFRVR